MRALHMLEALIIKSKSINKISETLINKSIVYRASMVTLPSTESGKMAVAFFSKK
jgi:hypothetical protein